MIGGTVGVLGCGLNVVYPPQHKDLTAEIREKGLLLSEYPPDISPDARFFPQRNRIISGLTKGTIVVEAREKSGALLTAESALDQNRDLFAVPGMLTSALSKGPNRLIQRGAKLITEAADVLIEYDQRVHRKPSEPPPELNEAERALYSLLSMAPRSADKLSEATGFNVGTVLACLTGMQLKGHVMTVGSEYHCSGRSA